MKYMQYDVYRIKFSYSFLVFLLLYILWQTEVLWYSENHQAWNLTESFHRLNLNYDTSSSSSSSSSSSLFTKSISFKICCWNLLQSVSLTWTLTNTMIFRLQYFSKHHVKFPIIFFSQSNMDRLLKLWIMFLTLWVFIRQRNPCSWNNMVFT